VLSLLMGRTDTTGPAGDLLGVDAGPVSPQTPVHVRAVLWVIT